jgi:hypothetical protein
MRGRRGQVPFFARDGDVLYSAFKQSNPNPRLEEQER